jgi:hypothetical protein
LAASPDGVINGDELVEVKCPYVNRNKMISTLTVPFLIQDDNGEYAVKDHHDYYYQIQGQLLCSGAKMCTLVVCLADKLKINDIAYIKIQRDEVFIAQMVQKLTEFYDNFFKNAILEKNFYKTYHD